jgi:hypothetical protein
MDGEIFPSRHSLVVGFPFRFFGAPRFDKLEPRSETNSSKKTCVAMASDATKMRAINVG